MKFISILFSAFVLSLLSSCGSSVDCNANSFVNEVNTTILALNNAGQAYFDNPTPTNCDTYKKAANEYLNVVEDYKDCDELDQLQYQQTLDQARAAVNSISCN